MTWLAALVLLAPALPAPEEGEWARFRGKDGAGISRATTVPAKWTERDYNWKVKLPGGGHSSPVVWGERVFVTACEPKTAQRTIVCLHAADGRELWRRDYASKPFAQHRDNSLASATPAVDAERVYVTWTTPEEVTLLALTHAGQEKWRRNLGPYQSQHGSGTSPVVVGELVVLANDQDGKSFLIAVDRARGETRWQVERRSALTPASTPCVYQPAGGRAQLIFTSMAHGLSGYDAATGKLVWEVPEVFRDRCVASPVVAPGATPGPEGDLIIGTFGFGSRGTRLVAVRPGDRERGIEPKLVWDLTKAVPLVPTPLAHDGRLYLWADDGRITCVRAATGALLWQERGRGEFYASPIWVNGKVYCVSKEGEVVVLAAGDKYELIARLPLGERAFATPAVSGGRMYLRTYTHLISIGGRKMPGS